MTTRPRLLFHIGDPKTGSSSIQTTLHRRAWRCEAVRLAYPPYLSDAKFAKALHLKSRAGQVPGLFAEKRAWLDGLDADVAVISAEHFSHVGPRRMRRELARHLPGYAPTARFAAYVRPHAQRLLSAYAQNVKCGSFFGSLGKYRRHAAQQAFFVYAARFKGWRAAFGERFVLRPMIRDRLHGGDVVADFLHVALEGAAFALDPIPAVNESLTLRQLACVREAQRVLRDAGVHGGVRTAVGTHFGTTLAARPSRQAGERLHLDRALVERIREDYADDADALDRAFFGEPLMRAAFDAAAAAAGPATQSVEMGEHAPAAAVERLRREAAALAEPLGPYGAPWRRARLKEAGQNADAPTDPETLEGVGRVKTRLADLADLIDELCLREAAAV